MVRTGNLTLVALFCATLQCASAEDQLRIDQFRKLAKELQQIEQKVALYSATGDEKELKKAASESLTVAEKFNKFSDLTVAYKCGFAAVRLSNATVDTMSGRGVAAFANQRNYLALMTLCEGELGLRAPERPNLR